MQKMIRVNVSTGSFVYKSLKYLKTFLLNNIFLSQYQWTVEHLMDEKKRNQKLFEKLLKRPLVINNPTLYNDKIQWLKFNWYSPIANKLVDKYEVRSYVAELIGEDHLNGLIGVYNKVEEINYESLPLSFALKCTHGSGFNIICTDKSNLNWIQSQRKVRLWLKTKYYLTGNEFVYKGVKPRIIIEQFLSTRYEKGINDYKFFTFHGKVKFLYISYKKFDSFGNMSKKRRYFNPEWKEITVNDNGCVIFLDSMEIKPPFIDRMIEICEILAKQFPHVRVDLHYERNKILFSELTFFHSNGMEDFPSLGFEKFMGQYLDIDKL